jgi:hypothetical protein
MIMEDASVVALTLNGLGIDAHATRSLSFASLPRRSPPCPKLQPLSAGRTEPSITASGERATAAGPDPDCPVLGAASGKA